MFGINSYSIPNLRLQPEFESGISSYLSTVYDFSRVRLKLWMRSQIICRICYASWSDFFSLSYLPSLVHDTITHGGLNDQNSTLFHGKIHDKYRLNKRFSKKNLLFWNLLLKTATKSDLYITGIKLNEDYFDSIENFFEKLLEFKIIICFIIVMKLLLTLQLCFNRIEVSFTSVLVLVYYDHEYFMQPNIYSHNSNQSKWSWGQTKPFFL